MAATREELQHRLDKLEANLPFLSKEHPDPNDLAQELAGYTHEITDAADAEDRQWVILEIDRVINNFGFPNEGSHLPPNAEQAV
jgi:hypothetical protein